MDAQVAFAAAAVVVSTAFAMVTIDRWTLNRVPHLLAWSLALTVFAAASSALLAGAALGWDEPTFRAFYLLGGVLNVPVLALGTVYLFGGRRLGDRVSAAVALFCAFATGVLVTAPADPIAEPDVLPQGSEVFGPLPRVLAAIGSSVPAVVILAGAVWTVVRVLRSGGPHRLAAGNACIAAGVVALSLGGLLNSVADQMTVFALSLVVGVGLLFAGFLLATARPIRQPAELPVAPDQLSPRRSTFPEAVRGSSSTTEIDTGHL